MDSASWACLQGDWDTYKAQVKGRWGKLTDDDLIHVGGNRDALVVALQQRYGLARDRAEEQVEEFAGTNEPEGWLQRTKAQAASLAERAKEYYQHHKVSEM